MKSFIIAAIGFLLVSQASAAPGDRFTCNVAHIQTVSIEGKQDYDFIEKSKQKVFEITILTDTISSRHMWEGKQKSKEYKVISDGFLDIAGLDVDDLAFGADIISVAKRSSPKYEYKYPISLTLHNSSYVSVWLLLCDKS
jgi:hypothetical protein